MPTEKSLAVDIPFLNRSHVYMADKQEVIRKIEKICNDGPEKLQIVTDYDRTITKQHVDGQDVLSSFGLFYKCEQIPNDLKKAERELFDKFRPIELDHDLDLDKKIAAMEEWMIKTRDLLTDIDFDPCEIDKTVTAYGTALRDGVKDLFEDLEKAEVPILVFSAGLGDVVHSMLKCHDVMLSNVKIISNFLNYNGKKLDGFKNQKMIHVFNKNEHAVDDDYFTILKGRNNVILMGDMTGDAAMADGVIDPGAILKIGFLYDNAEKLLPSYLEAFDIVVEDDQTMDLPRNILKKILQR